MVMVIHALAQDLEEAMSQKKLSSFLESMGISTEERRLLRWVGAVNPWSYTSVTTQMAFILGW